MKEIDVIIEFIASENKSNQKRLNTWYKRHVYILIQEKQNPSSKRYLKEENRFLKKIIISESQNILMIVLIISTSNQNRYKKNLLLKRNNQTANTKQTCYSYNAAISTKLKKCNILNFIYKVLS
jgi:hypothetical protein